MPDIINILSPGPSIQLFKPDDSIVIGVNRAALYCRCDVISCYNLFNWKRVVDALDYVAPIICPPPAFKKIKGGYSHINSKRLPAPNAECLKYSVTTAIAYAISLKPHIICCYGNDWDGYADWDGVSSDVNRKDRIPKNYKKQMQLFNKLVEFAKPTTQIRRITYDNC